MSQEGTYDSVLVADFLLAKANEKKRFMNVTKVQKLLYISYGLVYADCGIRLVDEHPQAWPFGPVFPKTRKKANYSVIANIADERFSEIVNDKPAVEAIDAAIEHFGIFSAGRLSDWSHEDGSPWHKTTKQPNFHWGMEIPDMFIGEYFSQFINK